MPEEGWVLELLNTAVQKNWCTRIGCSLCNAIDFCGAIENYLQSDCPSGRDPSSEKQRLIQQLSKFAPPRCGIGRGYRAFEALLVYAWYRMDDLEEQAQMQLALSGSFAGDTLDFMIRRYEDEQARRAERSADTSAYITPEERKERMAARQRAHQERLLQKSIRDEKLTEIAVARYREGLSRAEMFNRLLADGILSNPS